MAIGVVAGAVFSALSLTGAVFAMCALHLAMFAMVGVHGDVSDGGALECRDEQLARTSRVHRRLCARVMLGACAPLQ